MKIFKQTLPAAIALVASSLGGMIAQPATALTPAEAKGIGIGVAALTCVIAKGCEVQTTHHHGYYDHYRPHRRNYYRPRVYREPVFVPVPVPVVPKYRDAYIPKYRGAYAPNYQARRDITPIINRIYVEELGRNADREGLYTYQDRFDNGWSIEDIRRDIANSQEARNRYYHRY
ncbi:MAG: hypothetical protein SFT94_06320 [Pseudanabaenaceae cyanobacterium bins.68]|nr:hypothetical protein [Pseudanabaenaceae cyanobacterium bins.68]